MPGYRGSLKWSQIVFGRSMCLSIIARPTRTKYVNGVNAPALTFTFRIKRFLKRIWQYLIILRLCRICCVKEGVAIVSHACARMCALIPTEQQTPSVGGGGVLRVSRDTWDIAEQHVRIHVSYC